MFAVQAACLPEVWLHAGPNCFGMTFRKISFARVVSKLVSAHAGFAFLVRTAPHALSEPHKLRLQGSTTSAMPPMMLPTSWIQGFVYARQAMDELGNAAVAFAPALCKRSWPLSQVFGSLMGTSALSG